MALHQRFGGIIRLYGKNGFERLRSSTVAVVGIGGVGSWTAEALARSGVGSIILMDMDDLCITNTNRQIHALDSTTGQMKIDAMAKRINDISPETEATPLHSLYTESKCRKAFQS